MSPMSSQQLQHDRKGPASQSEQLHLEEWNDFDYNPLQISDILTSDLSLEFRHVFGLLYAVKASKERSLRALHLTSRAIRLHPSNPTVWMLRHQVVKALAEKDKAVWARELSFLTNIITSSPKNYQAWEHRRFIVTGACCLEAELGFADLVLANDSKNYHAWSHRQWLVRDHGITRGELEATEWFIQTDVRNNSAWNHRWLVTGAEGKRDEKEMDFAIQMMRKAPRNEAVWNYIQALSKEVGTQQAAKSAEDALEADAACVPARRFLVLNGRDLDKVREHCKVLMATDQVRKTYWKKRWDLAEIMLLR